MEIGLLALLAFLVLFPICSSTENTLRPLKMCQYCASQDFVDNTLSFVERQVKNNVTGDKYIADRECNSTLQDMQEIKCMGRCFTMLVNYRMSGVQATAEVRSCEVLHFEVEEREKYKENRCYDRTFQGKEETFCFCDNGDHCNNKIVYKSDQKVILESATSGAASIYLRMLFTIAIVSCFYTIF
ncbi:hypothetical protein L596_021710 [Steinernema carpocapsae]|uniref:Protein quiver n=1 Tax=Steinernema carpocapsae TaxID=34508 RepID=A0A4U5MJJ3_STECR|nr:hypothetical protein L596_021710 [Steinernema carpocapsae]